MYAKPKALASYGKVATTETNPLAQVVMLYDGAIKFLNLAANDIENNDLNAKAEHSNRALDIISYMQSILDFERGGDVAPAYDVLYRSLTVMVLKASVNLDAAMMRQAAELLAPVRDAWDTNIKNSANNPAAVPSAQISLQTPALDSVKISHSA